MPYRAIHRAISAHGGLLPALIGLGVAACISVCDAHGQEVDSKASEMEPTTSATDTQSRFPGGYMGSTDCLACHKGQIRQQGFVRLIEPRIWNSDPHSKAFEFIDWSKSAETASRKLSQQICKKLGIDDIHQAQQCLSCHANWVAGLAQPPPFYVDGVACESCHGPGLEWELLHRQQDWRAVSVAEKAAKNMIDVRNPVRRAEQCFSCHIGNVAEGKLITHEMYAAGHPPLPGIEIESFAAQMPRHWRYLDEKVTDSRKTQGQANPDAPPFELFDEFVRENHTYLRAANPAETVKLARRHNHGAAAVVLGGVVALRESIELTRDLANPESHKETPWPEFASFDCTACHHDLKQADARGGHNAASRPGRPALHAWPRALAQLAIFHISDDTTAFNRQLGEFESRLSIVQNELESTPFGNPSRLLSATSEFSQWLTDELITPVAQRPFDDRAVRLACARLVYLSTAEQQPDFDFDSARQIAWALRALYCDLDEKPATNKQIQVLFQRLAKDLRLNLPNSLGGDCEPAEVTATSRNALRDTPLALASHVAETLAAEVQFDSERFKRTMSEIGALLK